MIARVARFRLATLEHREEAERNASDRVAPSLARQPGFRAVYFGRFAELEAFSVSLFDDREAAGAAGVAMNAQPLLAGQVPEMLPSPEAVAFFDVVSSVVHDLVPAVGRLGYLALAPDQNEAAADLWVTSFSEMLEGAHGLCQVFFLRAPDSAQRISLTFWSSLEAMEAGGAAIAAWQAGEASAGRRPAYVAKDSFVLTDLLTAIAGVPATMPDPAG